MQQRPPPEVTVIDPARPAERFVAAPSEDVPPAQGRRWWAAVLVVLVAGAAVLVVRDVAEQRRLDGVARVQLDAPLLPATSRYDPSSGTATLETVLQLRNTGPRPVRVVSAELGGLRFDGDVRMAARTGTAGVPLTRTVRCPADGSRPPAGPDVTDVVLGVVTPAGPREVSLRTGRTPVDASRVGPARACGYPPLEEAVRVFGTLRTADAGRVVRARIEVTNSSRRRPQVLSIGFARGLDVLRLDGGATTLPVDLGPPALGEPSTVAVEVDLGINCGAMMASRGFGLGVVDVLVEDVDDRDLATVHGRLSDLRELRQVVRSCASG